MQFALAAPERIAPDQQDARFQDKRVKAFDWFGREGICHFKRQV